MKVFITAGSTATPLDMVRRLIPFYQDIESDDVAISNIFSGRTGTAIAHYFDQKGCDVTLATSNPSIVEEEIHINVLKYKTYEELKNIMAEEISKGGYDAVIHSAAVSDYSPEGLYVKDSLINDLLQALSKYVEVKETERCHVCVELAYNNLVSLNKICQERQSFLRKLDSSGKVGSKLSELFIRLTPTDKLVDKIRKEWCFQKTLVKFKLEVGKSDNDLISIAKKSMFDSDASYIVANCLECAKDYAYIINEHCIKKVLRHLLPAELYEKICLQSFLQR